MIFRQHFLVELHLRDNKIPEKGSVADVEDQDVQEAGQIRQGPSLQQILGSDREKRLFTGLVNPDDTALLEKLNGSGTFELADYENIEIMRQDYLRRKERAEQVKQLFSPDILNTAAVAQSELGAAIRLMSVNGAERVQQAILSQIDSYAFQDKGEKFEQFAGALEILQKQQEAKEKQLAQIDNYTKLYNIPSHAYNQVMEITDPDTRTQAMQKLVRKSMNWFDRIVVSDEEVKHMAGYSDNNENALGQSYEEIGQNMEGLAASLRMMVDENVDVKEALSKEVRSETPEGNPAAFADAHDFVLETKGYDEQWENFRQGVAVDGKGWEQLSGTEQERQRSSFFRSAFGKQRTLQGFWRSAKTFFQTAYVNSYRAYL